MTSNVNVPQGEPLNTDKPEITKKIIKGIPSEGRMAAWLGSGANAINSIIVITIISSFSMGFIISIGLYFRPAYCDSAFQGSLIEDIKVTWSIFLPIITLALGYFFGKGK